MVGVDSLCVLMQLAGLRIARKGDECRPESHPGLDHRWVKLQDPLVLSYSRFNLSRYA